MANKHVQLGGIPILAVDLTGDDQEWLLGVSSVSGGGSQQSNAVGSTVDGSTILPASDSRKGFRIQNVGTNPLFVKLGSGATNTDYSLILQGGVGDADGKGGVFESFVYSGDVSIAGTSPKARAVEYV